MGGATLSFKRILTKHTFKCSEFKQQQNNSDLYDCNLQIYIFTTELQNFQNYVSTQTSCKLLSHPNKKKLNLDMRYS